MPRQLLLISTSAVHGTPYLEHARSELLSFLEGCARLLFIPYALRDHDGYAARFRAALADAACSVESLHEAASPRRAVEQADAIFCGGGNTFRLLKSLYDRDLVGPIRERAARGLRYSGASAGANLAGPTIRTTNDMPIVEPPSLDALGLVRFQINPHYLDPDPASTHMGETRETRLKEFHEENETPVAGLREGAMLRVEGERVVLLGLAGARIFRRGQEPVEVAPGSEIQDLVEAGPR
jgi:dipeptidase E